MDNITKETTEQIFEAVTGRKFIPDVDAAQALYVANILEQYIKLRLTAVSGSLPPDINDFFEWLCNKGWIDGIANTSANNPNIFYEPKDLYELFRSGNDR